MTTATPPTEFLHLVVGYDGSPPADRALDAAVRLLQGRTGRIEVVYVAHLSSITMLSPGAIAEMENDFDEIEQELRTQAAARLRDSGAAWEFQRRQGVVAEELIAGATAIGEAHPGEVVVVIVGSSSHATHRVVGSVAVGLARHSPVPLVIVPQQHPDPPDLPPAHGKISQVQIGILGSFEVRRDDGVFADVPGARLRALLIALALEPRHVVPKATLVDWIWGEHPPRHASRGGAGSRGAIVLPVLVMVVGLVVSAAATWTDGAQCVVQHL